MHIRKAAAAAVVAVFFCQVASSDELFMASMERRLEADMFVLGENTLAVALPWPELTASAMRYGLMQAYIEVQYPDRRSREWMPLPVVILGRDAMVVLSVVFLEGKIDISLSASPMLMVRMLNIFEGAVFRAVLVAPKWTQGGASSN